MYIDLHGYSVHDAWKKYRSTTQECFFNETKRLTVVTGYGVMQKEFVTWVANDPYAESAKSLDPNKGAWRVTIRKQSTKKKVEEPQPINLQLLYKKFNKNS
jgi:DNA-nicking Smr family endonuclease